MFNKFSKNLNPLHIVLAVAAFLVAVIIIVLIVRTINFNDFITKTENKTFDSRQVMLVNNKIKKPNKDIVIVTIDDASYEYLTNKYGEWPLPRTVYADLIHFLEKQNPTSISFDLMFVSSLKSNNSADDKLASAMNAYDNILTGMNFDDMSYEVRQPVNLPARLQLTVHNKSNVDFEDLTFTNCRTILSQIINSNTKIGILNIVRSSDGIVREFPAVVKYQNDYYPNLAFLTALNYQSQVDKRAYNEITIDKNSNILVSNKKIPINRDGGLILNWYGHSQGQTYEHIPLYKLVMLMNGEKIKEQYDFKDKIIFVGTTATSMADVKSIPITGAGETYPGVEIYATFMNNFIDNNFIKKATPETNALITLLLVVLVGSVVIKTNSTPIAVSTAIVTAFGYTLFTYFAMMFGNVWLDIVIPVISIITIFVIAYIVKYIIKSRDFEHQYKLATTDGLTELYNHRYFQDQMRRQIAQSQRYNNEFSMIIVDIDHFKSFNDTYGHQAGDAVLRQVAQTLKTNSRSTDIVCRYGGEEMSIILTNTGKEEAIIKAKNVCDAVAQRIFKLSATQTVHVTISVGVSTFPEDGETPQQIIEIADQGLYYAKEHGRNQVGLAIYNETPPEQ
ncbi:diguanylate cyclase [bacterium]|nr:diguanylate cyclase [bacterium]